MTSRDCLPANGSDAKRVEHALDELAGGGDLALVAAVAFGDPLPVGADPGAGVAALHRLDRGPADQPGPLLGDPPAVHGDVGLPVARGQTGPAGQLSRSVEPAHIADLGAEDRAHGRADAGDGLHRGVARVVAQPVAGKLAEGVDLDVDVCDEPQAGVHPGAHRRRQPHRIQKLTALGAGQVGHGDRHPGAGQDRMHLALEAGAQPDELRPVPDEFAQFPAGRRGDPRLGESPETV